MAHFSLVILCLAVASAYAEVLGPPADAVGELGSGTFTQLMNVTVPVCSVDEFLTSDGTQLLCRPLPEPICDCQDPSLGIFGSGQDALIPLPPEGCQMFVPPTRGAFVCLRLPDVIYCSVLCDHQFEFDSTPRNFYYCGMETRFQWLDSSNQPRSNLPQCTGFRHRHRLLHRIEFYLPAPCYGLKDNTMLVIMEEFHMRLLEFICDPEQCSINDVYIQCPSVEATARYYDEIIPGHLHQHY